MHLRHMFGCFSGQLGTVGTATLPMKRIVPLNRSRSTKTKGRSKRMEGGRLVSRMPTVVTAAASVPSSFTFTNVFCFTKEIDS